MELKLSKTGWFKNYFESLTEDEIKINFSKNQCKKKIKKYFNDLKN